MTTARQVGTADAGLFRLGIHIDNYDELQAKLKERPIYKDPMAKALQKAALLGERDAKQFAPVDKGRMRASVTHRMEVSDLPKYAEVGTNVLYAKPLDMPERRNPHYSAGPNKGKETKGWLSGFLQRKQQEIHDLFTGALKEIDRLWRS